MTVALVIYDVTFRADDPGTWRLHYALHHASNAGLEPGGLIVPTVVSSNRTLPASGESVAPTSAGPAQPTHTMAPDMTEMPGMESMPGMDH